MVEYQRPLLQPAPFRRFTQQPFALTLQLSLAVWDNVLVPVMMWWWLAPLGTPCRLTISAGDRKVFLFPIC